MSKKYCVKGLDKNGRDAFYTIDIYGFTSTLPFVHTYTSDIVTATTWLDECTENPDLDINNPEVVFVDFNSVSVDPIMNKLRDMKNIIETVDDDAIAILRTMFIYDQDGR